MFYEYKLQGNSNCVCICCIYINTCCIYLKVCVASYEYVGHKATTVKGNTCKTWSSATMSPYGSSDFPESSKSAASNYCRDPSKSGYLWCYTNSVSLSWERCDVNVCDYTHSGKQFNIVGWISFT